MLSRQQPSKYECNVSLFSAEPPDDPRLIKVLFCGRERELDRGLSTLKANWDVRGRRAKRGDKHPWIIHGESRSGKSHLARRILAGLPASKKRIVLQIPARERISAALVMRQLFEKLNGEFCWRIDDQTLPQVPSVNPHIRAISRIAEQFRLFYGGGAAVATVTVDHASKEGGEVGTEVNGKLVKFIARYQTEQTQKHSLAVQLRHPTESDLAEFCGLMADALVQFRLVDHILLLIDDVDLLEGYVNKEQNARCQRSLLSEALIAFHDTPGVDVVLTSRSWYAHSLKDFTTLVDLTQSDMTSDELLAVCQQHQKQYGVRRAPCDFLGHDTIRAIADDSNRLPGIFLQHLKTAFQTYQDEPNWGQRDYEWFLEVFRKLFASFRDKCRPAAEALEAHIARGTVNVDVTKQNPFYGTLLENQFVYQSYFSETTYYIPGLVSKIVPSLPATPTSPASEA